MADIFFKEIRLEDEFKSYRLNQHLRAVLLDLGWYMRHRRDMQVMLTCIYRTPNENKAVNGNPLSAHLDWRAADIRTRDLKVAEVDDMVNHLRALWPLEMLHVIVHNSGAGPHMHININRGWALNHPGV